MDRLLLRRHLDALHALEFLDPALHLLGLGGLVAEAADERLELPDAVLLVLVGRLELAAPLLPLREVPLIVARVEVQLPVPQFRDLAHGNVQEEAVVGNHHDRVGVTAQVALQPVARLQVEVVGGLVQQQQVRLFEQQLGEGDAHLPTARKLLGTAPPVVLGEPQAGQHRARLCLDRVAVARAEFAVQALEAIRHLLVLEALRVEFRHAVGQALELFLHGAQIGKDRQALGKHGAAGKRQAILRQVARGQPARGGQQARIQRLDARQDLQHGAFAGAVGAHQADAIIGRNQPIHVLEQQLVPVALPRAGELQHGGSRRGR